MKGQKLFVRPSNEDDFESIHALHAASGEALHAETRAGVGLVGRLAGNTVACLAWRRDGSAMSISHILVAAELRGIRIGRALVTEAIEIAATEGADTVRVAQGCKIAAFFERCGFVSTDGTLIRRIR